MLADINIFIIYFVRSYFANMVYKLGYPLFFPVDFVLETPPAVSCFAKKIISRKQAFYFQFKTCPNLFAFPVILLYVAKFLHQMTSEL